LQEKDGESLEKVCDHHVSDGVSAFIAQLIVSKINLFQITKRAALKG
jgi:hypothetical protein